VHEQTVSQASGLGCLVNKLLYLGTQLSGSVGHLIASLRLETSSEQIALLGNLAFRQCRTFDARTDRFCFIKFKNESRKNADREYSGF
jgi:hypothetical protein